MSAAAVRRAQKSGSSGPPLDAGALALPPPPAAPAGDAPADELGAGSLDEGRSEEVADDGEAAGGSDSSPLADADADGPAGDPVALALPHAATTRPPAPRMPVAMRRTATKEGGRMGPGQ